MSENQPIGECLSLWFAYKCPHCDEVNWVYSSVDDDSSKMDPEACMCHGCKKEFWLGREVIEYLETVDGFARLEENAYVVNGLAESG